MKTLFNILEKTAVGTFGFWLIETLFFIIRDGWHLKAVTADEKACDSIVSIGRTIIVTVFILIIYKFLKLWENTHSITKK